MTPPLKNVLYLYILKNRAITNYIKKSNVLAHLAKIQQQYDTDCEKRDKAKSREQILRLIESSGGGGNGGGNLNSAMRIGSASMDPATQLDPAISSGAETDNIIMKHIKKPDRLPYIMTFFQIL